SASWCLPSMRRQTPNTIGPCRHTSTSKAASSRELAKRSSKRASLNPPSHCWATTRRSRLRTGTNLESATILLPGVRPATRVVARSGKGLSFFSSAFPLTQRRTCQIVFLDLGLASVITKLPSRSSNQARTTSDHTEREDLCEPPSRHQLA